MKETYQAAIAQILKDEGGYTNESTDPGGPTNWGITIHDARKYWLPSATAEDVKNMPLSVAEDIYKHHYASPVYYDLLPAGVDYTVLDYAVNSGISRSVKVLQSLVGVPQDGVMGSSTIQAVRTVDPTNLINQIWDERLAFDKSLTHLWPTYGHGWTNRINSGRALAHSLAQIQKPSDLPNVAPVGSKSIFSTISSFINNLFKGK